MKNCLLILIKKLILLIFSNTAILDSKHSKFRTIIQVFEDLNVLSISKLKAKNFDQFDLVETIHKLRDIGADHMFLLEVQIVPRSDTDKRNILQVRSNERMKRVKIIIKYNSNNCIYRFKVQVFPVCGK